MYESPIEAIVTEMQTQVMRQRENDIYQAVQSCGVTVYKEELLKALQYDREQYEKGYEDGYKNATNDAVKRLEELFEKYPLKAVGDAVNIAVGVIRGNYGG